jgi:hypothetical protein
MKNLNINNIVEAKSEYTKQLVSTIVDHVYNKITSIYEHIYLEESNKKKVLMEFQKKLKDIPNWNSITVESEVRTITNSCSYFSDLLAAVFVSNVKILTSVKIHSSKRKIKIKMPSNESFIHNVYIRVAEEIYNNPYLYSQKNVLTNKKDVHAIITISVEDVIRYQLPLKNILENINASSDEDSEPEDPEPEDRYSEDPEPDDPEPDDPEPDNPEPDDPEPDDPEPDDPEPDNPVHEPAQYEFEKTESNSTQNACEPSPRPGFFDKPEIKTIPLATKAPQFFDDATDE